MRINCAMKRYDFIFTITNNERVRTNELRANEFLGVCVRVGYKSEFRNSPGSDVYFSLDNFDRFEQKLSFLEYLTGNARRWR